MSEYLKVVVYKDEQLMGCFYIAIDADMEFLKKNFHCLIKAAAAMARGEIGENQDTHNL